eukprot:7382734-Prymnesium_polylepis.1
MDPPVTLTPISSIVSTIPLATAYVLMTWTTRPALCLSSTTAPRSSASIVTLCRMLRVSANG